MRKLPIYKLKINPDDQTGVDYVALVDQPAIEIAWQAFSNQQRFKADTEKRIISGPLMVANLPIYRNDPEHGEHYVIFDKDTVKEIVLKFFQNRFTGNVNLMHESMAQPENVFMFESFIVDRSRMNPPKGFEQLSDGSWFGSYKVNNDEVWENFIKTGEFTGFSVEGFFDYADEFNQAEDKIKKVIEIIHSVDV